MYNSKKIVMYLKNWEIVNITIVAITSNEM